jgi:hypothetical protein
MVIALAVSPCLAGDTIYSCSLKQVGTLRMVDSPSKCAQLETPISWNIKEPQGVSGLGGGAGAIIPAVFGTVQPNGEIISGKGFNVDCSEPPADCGIGIYRVKFDTPFTSEPVCLGKNNNDNPGNVNVFSNGLDSILIATSDVRSRLAAMQFQFLCVQ